MNILKFSLIIPILTCSIFLSGQSNKVFTKSAQQITKDQNKLLRHLSTDDFFTAKLDHDNAARLLEGSEGTIMLPDPLGEDQEFTFYETKVIADEVAHYYTTKTFRGYKKGEPSVQVAFDLSEQGLFAMVFDGTQSYSVEPQSGDIHISFYKKDLKSGKTRCGVADQAVAKLKEESHKSLPLDYRITYRMALVASGEYGQAFGGTPYSPTNVLNALASGMNIVNAIYLRDLGIDFLLVTTPDLVFDDPTTDPFDTTDPDQLMNETNEQCILHLGANGFDIGHLVIWDNVGGLAGISVVCIGGRKAEGFSGTDFSLTTLWVDYVCHELGHQFGAVHNFSSTSCGTSSNGFRYEPGEGSSIMSYAGVCGPPAQYANGTNPYFHYASIERITQRVGSIIGLCGARDPGNNPSAPVVNAGPDIMVPLETPFILIGDATDGNDPMTNFTYDWEQFDGDGNATNGPPDCQAMDSPLFKFNGPSANPYRFFPSYNDVISGNNTGNTWEVLPCNAISMDFSLAVRDNNTDFGRISHDIVTVTTSATGPFGVTSPNGGETVNGGNTFTVTWDENNTSTHCSTVDIFLSINGGISYGLIEDATANDGSQNILIPNLGTSAARILISCDGPAGFGSISTFYDVSDADFLIMPLPGPDNDMDGFPNTVDCDDNNPNVYPGAAEICNNIDDNCSGLIDDADPLITGQSTWYADNDSDGYGDNANSILSCAAPTGYVADNTDCDDTDPNINPSAPEICNGVDDDCNGLIDTNDPNVSGSAIWYIDADGDTYGDANGSLVSCTQPTGYVSNDLDCDDSDLTINPGAQEVCNNIDDDCDGLVDDNDPSLTGGNIYYLDSDNDGYGDPSTATLSCNPLAGYIIQGGDCNDSNASVNPGAQEICNFIDDDCDGLVDGNDPSVTGGSLWFLDNDGDGYGAPLTSVFSCSQPAGYVPNDLDCNDNNISINPNAQELCNGIDDDCDGLIDDNDPNLVGGNNWYQDLDGDGFGNPSSLVFACSQPAGYVNNNSDCVDNDSSINPSAQEICNGIDDDCDGLIDGNDPSLIGGTVWYQDNDLDGYGDPNNSTISCLQPTGFVNNNGDCNDNDQNVSPSATEICNGIDDDCDGLLDQSDPNVSNLPTWFADLDNDGYGNPFNSIQACQQPANFVSDNTDCDDGNSLINPGITETCNGIDDNCNGLIDQADPSVDGGSIWFLDNDGDGYGDRNNSILDCSSPAGYVANDLDCNDANPLVNPAAIESCNGMDDDCDGLIDDADPNVQGGTVWFRDSDNDGYGNNNETTIACSVPNGYVSNNTDCNDNDGGINPAAAEVCNSIDDNCNGLIDDSDPTLNGGLTWFLDQDNDGYGDAASSIFACTQPQGYVANNGDCNDMLGSVYPGATEICNTIDDDCDGLIDGDDPDIVSMNANWYLDADGDGYGDPNNIVESCEEPQGYVLDNSDCNDSDAQINPAAQEVCNGKDDNCDGLTDLDDPNIAGVGLWFADNDEDGFGDPNNTVEDCVQPPGYIANNQDCNDFNPEVNPDAEEICNSVDDNCDGLIDEEDPSIGGLMLLYLDMDGDGFGDPDTEVEACGVVDGFVENGLDCNDEDSEINPQAEEIPNNGIDEDCDGMDGTVSTTDGNELEINVFPNPFIDRLFIEVEQFRTHHVKLYNIEGQIVYSDKLGESRFFELGSLPAGTYLLEVKDEKASTIKKLIKLD